MRRKIVSVILAVSILSILMPDTAMAARMERKPTTVTVRKVPNQTKKDEDTKIDEGANKKASRDTGEDLGALLEGSGSETDPYRIQDAEQLRLFVDMVNGVGGAANTGICAVLTQNIDLSSICGDGIGSWVPIGKKARPYTGVFDGASFVISGLYYSNSGAAYAGLFGYNSGVIKNLGLAGDVTAGNYTGGVCGFNNGTITGCYSAASVKGGRYTGGVCGFNESGSVNICYNTGAVSGSKYVGGISGYNKNLVTDCYNTGTVNGSSTSVGGICGYNKKTVSDCYNTGVVSGKGTDYVGSICGYNHSESSFLNNYYLITGTENGNYGTAMTRGRFESGEVCWLLNGGESENVVWHQTCGAGFPDFGGKTVYQVQMYRGSGDAEELVSWYTNDQKKSGFQPYTAAAAEENSGDDSDEYSEDNWSEMTDGHIYQKPEWKWEDDYKEATAVFICQECGEKIKRKASIKEDITKATCTAEGKTVYTASVKLDEKKYEDTKTVAIAKLGHQPLEQVWVESATCEKSGIKRNCWTCPACKKYFEDQEGTVGLSRSDVVEPALGHNYSAEGKWTWSDNKSSAALEINCVNNGCDKKITRYGTIQTKTTATCTNPGETTYTATVNYNGKEYTDTKTEPGKTLPHDYSNEPTWNWSDDKRTATATFKCAFGCGTTVEEKGDVQPKTTTATCTVPGDTVYTATVKYNNKQYQDTQTDPGKTLPHDYSDEPEWNWSDDRSTATAIFSCSYGCGTTIEEKGKIEFQTEKATCTVPGDTVYTATVTYNNKEFHDTQTDNGKTLPHIYSDGPEWKWPDADSDEKPVAYVIFSCKYGCGNIKEVKADSTEAKTTKEATCKEPGEVTYTATVKYEDETYTKTSKPIKGKTGPHKYSGEPVRWDWTGLESGADEDVTATAFFACEYGCNTTEDVEAKAENIKTDTQEEATCEKEGKAIYTATVNHDGKDHSSEPTEGVIPLGDHTMDAPVEAVEETCEQPGRKAHWKCSVCERMFDDKAGTAVLEEKDIVIPAKGHDIKLQDNGDYRCSRCEAKFIRDPNGTQSIYSTEDDAFIILEMEENDKSVSQSTEEEKVKEESADGELPAGLAIEEGRKDDESLSDTEQAPEGDQAEQITQEEQTGQESQETQTEPVLQETQGEQASQEPQEEQNAATEQTEQIAPDGQSEQGEPEEKPEQESGEEGTADVPEENAHYGLVYPLDEADKAAPAISDTQEESAVNLRAKAVANSAVKEEQEQMGRSVWICVAVLAAFTGMLLILILRKKE